MSTPPTKSVDDGISLDLALISAGDQAVLLEELWRGSGAEQWALTRGDFTQILLRVGESVNYGLRPGSTASPEQESAYLRGLRIEDLALARGCARGHERAWEHFMAIYDAPLTSASIRITGNETKGRAMAEALYAELLYGFRREDGQDEKLRCPLDSYQGRGSLLGWMGKLLAQRSVDGFRRVRRETPFDPVVHDKPREAVDAHPVPEELSTLGKALAMAVSGLSAEDRFLLAAYFLDGRTLRQIGQLLDPTVHESTVSRRLKDLLDAVRKQVLRNLQTQGLSKRAAQEALEADPRDLDVNLKKLLQASQNETFRERTGE